MDKRLLIPLPPWQRKLFVYTIHLIHLSANITTPRHATPYHVLHFIPAPFSPKNAKHQYIDSSPHHRKRTSLRNSPQTLQNKPKHKTARNTRILQTIKHLGQRLPARRLPHDTRQRLRHTALHEQFPRSLRQLVLFLERHGRRPGSEFVLRGEPVGAHLADVVGEAGVGGVVVEDGGLQEGGYGCELGVSRAQEEGFLRR